MKDQFVTKGYTQTYGVDYFKTFSLVARLNLVRILISLTVNFSWHLHQLDTKNAFLYGDFSEEVYQPPRFVTQGESTVRVCKLNKAI